MLRIFRKRRAVCPAPRTPETTLPRLYTTHLVNDGASGIPFVALSLNEDADLDTPERTRAAAAQYTALADRLHQLANEQQKARDSINRFRTLVAERGIRVVELDALGPGSCWYDNGQLYGRPILVVPAGQCPVQRLAAARRLIAAAGENGDF